MDAPSEMYRDLFDPGWREREAEWDRKLMAAVPQINRKDYGLPPYPTGHVVGPCVCGSWPGGECLRCPVMPPATQEE